MKLLRKLAAGFLLTWGFLFLVVPVAVLPDKNASQDDRDQAIGCLVLGLPTAAWGAWLVWGLYRQREQEKRDRLQATFYRLLQENNGSVTILSFAMAANLPGEAAKVYLDAKAREFGAIFDVSDQGSLTYQFDQQALQLLNAATANSARPSA